MAIVDRSDGKDRDVSFSKDDSSNVEAVEEGKDMLPPGREDLLGKAVQAEKPRTAPDIKSKIFNFLFMFCILPNGKGGLYCNNDGRSEKMPLSRKRNFTVPRIFYTVLHRLPEFAIFV